ncbi:MAG: maltose alpha-D-glucosyltransferase, partial [Acidimicrobiia bacterium]|nr:maltose alpha-D-glucosyltransferase [Acidimicrobiia bacterium]
PEPWFKTAVFYEVPVYAFFDSNGDGVGDFEGMRRKLDYLEWLGVDCIWLLPFYRSPLRDGGYDVSDFAQVLPRYGTVDDVTRFLDAAHQRGMRVIADTIVNHTSDQHPWFEAARQPGSPTRDWYVWSDDPTRWSEARVIFLDTHDSNWTWDDIAGAYYWHRFFWHQPDLNFDHPGVREAMENMVRFWLAAGFDGLRLDAVPYLYERDGTNGENLPETHGYLKELRAMVDTEFPEAILLAEANQRPAEVVEYFGDGDECHMAFHFPVMPRLYMAIATGDATPIEAILAATPPIPDGCQWGIFLRNHDELSLEMVSEEERAFMYAFYAPDPAMRKNLGIRRRLAPLLGGDRRKIELMHALLLALPGSPILYYGDEIGMGDEYLLDDRDGVRTPMQWESSPGAGFSTAAATYLPVVTGAGYQPRAVNVADQRADESSLLHWVRSMLAVRRRLPILATGRFATLPASPPSVFAFSRTDVDGAAVMVANLSDATVDATVSGVGGYRPVHGPAPDGDTVTLRPYGFTWLQR